MFYVILALSAGLFFILYARMRVLVPDAKDETKGHLATLLSLHVIVCFLFSGLIRKGGEYVFKIDNLRSLRTWFRLLGGNMDVVDLIGQFVDIPEVDRSAGMQNLINDFSYVSQLSSFCLWASIIVAIIVYFLIKAKRGREIVRVSACLSHICSILVIYCGFRFYNSFSDYLWGIGGQINYLFLLIPICIAAIDIFFLSAKTLCDPGLCFSDSWIFDGIDSLKKIPETQEADSDITQEADSDIAQETDSDKKKEKESRVESATNKAVLSTGTHGFDINKLRKWGIPIGAAIVAAVVLLLLFIPSNDGRQKAERTTTYEIKALSDKAFNRKIVKADSKEAAILLASRLFSALAAKEHGSLYGLFAKEVEHYNETIPRASAVSFWAGYANCTLSVDGGVDLLDYSPTTASIGFVIQANDSNNTLIGTSPFYFTVKKEDGAWVIGAEGEFSQDQTQYQGAIDNSIVTSGEASEVYEGNMGSDEITMCFKFKFKVGETAGYFYFNNNPSEKYILKCDYLSGDDANFYVYSSRGEQLGLLAGYFEELTMVAYYYATFVDDNDGSSYNVEVVEYLM